MSDAKRAKADDAKKVFVDMHDSLRDEILNGIRKEYPDFSDAGLTHLTKVFDYNCQGGKMNRGLSVLAAFRSMKNNQVTAEEEKEANILGWCVEWLQAFFLIEDDIMDGSITRRSAPCWYKVHDIGLVAINDGCILETAIYKLFKTHFKGKNYYVDLLELMIETTWQTELGQLLDLITAPEDRVDLSKFNMDKYKCIVKYKTAFYSFYLPIAMAMLMAGIPMEDKVHVNAKKILLEMGEFFQIQDDYLDCYGTFEDIGKHGTDIQDNKCGWLINQALKICTPEQRQVLEANYAKKDDASVQRVKDVYKDLNLAELYKASEKESYAKITKMIEENRDSRIPDDVYLDFAKKIYFRKK